MTYYLHIENDKIISSGEIPMVEPFISVEVSEEVYNSYMQDKDLYIWDGSAIVPNPDYEEIKKRKHRQELDELTLTPSDVERALYYSKLKMDFDDLKAFIHEKLPNLDIKGLGIEFRAKDFYRGAIDRSNGMRIFDAVGALLGYSSEDMDYLFLHKELPNDESPDVST